MRVSHSCRSGKHRALTLIGALMTAWLLPASVFSADRALPGGDQAAGGSTTCQFSPRLAGQRFINVSDAAWRPDNPNAGRVVEVSFEATRYQLKVLGTGNVYDGTYRAQRLLDNVMAVDMRETHPLGPVHYQLLLSCLTPSQGRFVYTQFNGPILPARRQNTGQWNRVN